MSLAQGQLKLSCGLAFTIAAFKREDAVTFWRTYAVQLKEAHRVHHNLHSGVAASLILVTGAGGNAAYCSDDPNAPKGPASA